jgi:RNA polymerase sigma-70 factor (sigma-E family)
MSGRDPTFEEFMAARWGRLFRTAYLLMGERHEAEDLLQGALAQVCVSWSSIRDKAAAEGFTRTVMLRHAQRRWRVRGRETPTEHLPEVHDDQLAVRADHLILWAAVRRLPPRQRATIVLRFFEDLSVEATARELGCSTGAVKSQTHHAVRRLRTELPSLDLTEESS